MRPIRQRPRRGPTVTPLLPHTVTPSSSSDLNRLFPKNRPHYEDLSCHMNCIFYWKKILAAPQAVRECGFTFVQGLDKEDTILHPLAISSHDSYIGHIIRNHKSMDCIYIYIYIYQHMAIVPLLDTPVTNCNYRSN